ncbi:MAG: anti-sigma factor [Polyangiaceae bacterium]|nr:anti-sigma factor [Polyangiaceae bacterium]
MTTTPPMDRTLALACDRALVGLDPGREMELVASMRPGATLDPKLELAAAAIALAELTIDEPLPRHLADKIAASASLAPSSGVVSGGTMRMPPAIPDSSGPRPAATVLMPMKAPEPAPVVRIETARRRNWAPWLAAAACLGIAAATLLVLWPRGQRGPGATTVEASLSPAEARDRLLAEAKDAVRTPWATTDDPSAKGASGEVVWSNERQEGYMTFKSVAPNDPKSSQYQLWIFDAERDERYPVDGGVFDVGPDGEVVVPITARVPVGKPTLFAVTVEKPGGVVVSKRERILVTAKVPS